MDLQTNVLAAHRCEGRRQPLLEHAASLIAAAALRASVLVIYIVVGFRPGYPWRPPNNQVVRRQPRSLASSSTPRPPTSPRRSSRHDGDVVVVKHRVSAFAGTDLDKVLRAQGRDTLVLCGIATSGVVLSTLRAGADADYRLVVAKDACADADDEVHGVLIENVFARQATVATSADVVAALTLH